MNFSATPVSGRASFTRNRRAATGPLCQVLSGALTGNLRHQVYVAAIRLICDDADNADCWRLEKLAIDDRIVFDRGDSL